MAIVPKDQFPSSETDIENEAMQWLVQQYFDELSELETQEFFTWLDRSPQHRQIYMHMERMWAQLTEGDTLTMDAVDESANELIETLHCVDKPVVDNSSVDKSVYAEAGMLRRSTKPRDLSADKENGSAEARQQHGLLESSDKSVHEESVKNSESFSFAMDPRKRSEDPTLDENENLKVSHLPIVLAVLISILLVTFSILLSR